MLQAQALETLSVLRYLNVWISCNSVVGDLRRKQCEDDHFDCSMRAISWPSFNKKFKQATGFEEFVQELKLRYELPRKIAVQTASQIWAVKNEAFRASYRMVAVSRIKDDLLLKLEECEMLCYRLKITINEHSSPDFDHYDCVFLYCIEHRLLSEFVACGPTR